jgi:hypothetical protein
MKYLQPDPFGFDLKDHYRIFLQRQTLLSATVSLGCGQRNTLFLFALKYCGKEARAFFLRLLTDEVDMTQENCFEMRNGS